MNSSLLSPKNLITGVVVLALAGLAYFYFQGSSSSAGVSSLLTSTASSAGGVGSAELTLLSQIQSLQIDTSLFKLPSYGTLQDHTVPIPQQNVGRQNPFSPFPGAPAAAAGAN